MKKKDFKIGDRVIVTKSEYNGKGEIVSIEEDEYLIKFNKEIGTYKYSERVNYQSDKNDLWWVDLDEILPLISKKELLKRIEVLEAKVYNTFGKSPLLDLPEVKKELEVGKWYKSTSCKYLVKVIEVLDTTFNYALVSGFDGNGEWYEKWDSVVSLDCRESTSKEVEEALIKEAKKRGFEYDSYIFDERTNILWGNDNDDDGKKEKVLFNNGKWAEVIKNDDKFAELKEANNNGSVIQFNDGNGWYDIDYPSWIAKEYRIKPEEKPKVGDVCKFWDDDENVYLIGIIEEVISYNEFPFSFYGYDWFKNAEKITDPNIIALFKGNGAN